MSPDAERGPRQGLAQNIAAIINVEAHPTPDKAPVPLFGCIAWAASWSVHNATGISTDPLIVSDMIWRRALAGAD